MKTSDFYFELPERLVALYPAEKRGQSRLMILDRSSGKRAHETVSRLPEILRGAGFLSPSGEKPLLVFNDTKVRKARLSCKSEMSMASVEFLLLENLQNGEWKTLAPRAKRRKPGSLYIFFDSYGERINQAEITRAQEEFRFLKFEKPIDDAWLDKYGHIPLPPYIKREDNPLDADRYQTIYARQTGSAASPTAGLHFSKEILDNLSAYGVESAFVTLHVGLGTFSPVRSVNVEDHLMHEEKFHIDDQNALKIEAAKKAGRKIVAVGTTSARSLESAFHDGKIKRGDNATSIFIYPGYHFKAVDALFTNFHTPLSTLLMLVSAFATRELIMESYKEAVKEEYRFFSYGDAMLIY